MMQPLGQPKTNREQVYHDLLYQKNKRIRLYHVAFLVAGIAFYLLTMGLEG